MLQPEKRITTNLLIFKKDITPETKKRGIFWFCYFLICLLAQIWPIYLIGNRLYPFVLGMPFSMFWVVLWIVIIFIGLLIKFNQEYRR